jgi:RHS repeat-associated protein
MANISYRAASAMVSRYGYNGGNEYEDEGELNYSNTFYRKYDAQIGRFTGVDILAEAAAFINPYQYGYNNPVMFNDPNGDLSAPGTGRMQKGLDGNYHVGWYNDLMWGGIDGSFSTRGDGESYDGGGGGGGSSSFYGAMASLMGSDFGGTWTNNSNGGSTSFFKNDAQAFAAGAAYLDRHNAWGQYGFANSFGDAQSAYYANGGTDMNVRTLLPNITVYGSIKDGQWKTSRTNYSGFKAGSSGPILSYLYGGYNWRKTGDGWTAEIYRLSFEAKELKSSMPRATQLYVRVPVVCIQVPSRMKNESQRNSLVNTAYNAALEDFFGLLHVPNSKISYNDIAANQKFKEMFIYQISLTPGTTISFGQCSNVIPPSYPKFTTVNEYPR